LFDKTRPFYQASTVKDSVQNGAIIQLYFQGKNNATLFEHSTTGEPKAVSPAEAARFLIAFQGFDVGGIKADGSGQTSPLLNSAISLIRGENLFETLMFNWHSYNENDDEPFPFSVKMIYLRGNVKPKRKLLSEKQTVMLTF
jgi:CRISPR system Cascade subunit CasA